MSIISAAMFVSAGVQFATVPDGVLDKDGVLVRPRDEGRRGAWARWRLYKYKPVTGTLSSDYLLRCLIELFVFPRRKRELLIQSTACWAGENNITNLFTRIFGVTRHPGG